MTTFLAKPAPTTPHDAPHPAGPTSANANKKRLGAFAAGTLLALSGAALWTVTAVTTAGLDEAGPSVRLAGAVTSIEERSEPHVRAFSGPMVPLEPASTASQRNAVRTAEDYLDFAAFSREGLIEQLEFDDFSTADATFAVDHITVDWNEQAAKAAEAYLDFSGFSRGGLIDQLEFDGFTSAQAAYGATASGL
ncbi:Ltp family lipoprotein [Mycolicibacterium septicum]|uniref:Ltp family lipoprotein n=1 Tax=Mycolicibacterium septicum TaxID=98668 RepID=UPI001AFC1370|nr:Ltp family lipoprotein [Mycolicibacterium septicum]QRY53819.1 Ltp family lipoprotein [Mycolicibacterium septicum]